MAHFLWLLAGTIWLRPYVFIFLGAYLLIAIWHLGAGRALAFLVLGYLISWAAEFCLHSLRLSLWRVPLHPRHPGPGNLGGRGALHGFPVLCLPGLCQLFPGAGGLDPGSLGGETVLSPGGGRREGVVAPAHPGGGPDGDPGYRHRPPGSPGLPLVSGANLWLSRARGLFRRHLEQLRRLVPGGLRTHPGLAASHHPGARLPPGGIGAGGAFLPRPSWAPPFTWASWASTWP